MPAHRSYFATKPHRFHFLSPQVPSQGGLGVSLGGSLLLSPSSEMTALLQSCLYWPGPCQQDPVQNHSAAQSPLPTTQASP